MASLAAWLLALACVALAALLARRARRARRGAPGAAPPAGTACGPPVCELLLLDGCNLPLGLELRPSGAPPRLTSGGGRRGGACEDWGAVLAGLSGADAPFERASVLFDARSPVGAALGARARVQLSARVCARSTERRRASADDEIVEAVAAARAAGGGAAASAAACSPRDAHAELAAPPPARDGRRRFFVLRRSGGGERAHARLWRLLGLVRPEAVACLAALTPGLREQGARDALALCGRAAPFVRASRASLPAERAACVTVCTDDVLLARRVVDAGGLALSWRQLRALVAGVRR